MTLPYFGESHQAVFTPLHLGTVIQSNHLNGLLEELKKRIHKEVPQKISLLVENSTIKNWLQEQIKNFSCIDFTEPAQFDPFLRYKVPKELAEVFHLYAKYGDEALETWLTTGGEEASLYKTHMHRSVPIRSNEVHLFHPTHLPAWYLKALLHRSPKTELFVYVLTPSPLFLFDLVREKHLLTDLLQGAYLEDQNRLLANLIPYKLPLLKLIDATHETMVDSFVEPQGISALATLRQNIYHQTQQPIEPDASLACIPSNSILEEVETAYEYLLELLKAHPNLSASDITVFADLKLYGPYLEFVFQDRLALEIAQVPLLRFVPTFKPFARIFSLFDSPWTLNELRSLFIEDELAIWLKEVGFVAGAKDLLRAIDALTERMVFETPLPPFPISLMQSLITLKTTVLGLHQEIFRLKNALLPLEVWFAELKQLFYQFLPISEFDPFFETLETYRPLMTSEERPFSFVRLLLWDYFESLQGPLILNEGDRLVARNLKEGAIIPNKVFYVLGMGLKQFPSYCPLSPSYRLEKLPPTQGTIDRYRFLELILHANERLIFSYSDTAPSTLIEEVFR